MLLLLVLSSTAHSHGSSHPSCTDPYSHHTYGYSSHDIYAYKMCQYNNQKVADEQEAACQASVECMKTRKQHMYIIIGLISLFLVAFVWGTHNILKDL